MFKALHLIATVTAAAVFFLTLGPAATAALLTIPSYSPTLAQFRLGR